MHCNALYLHGYIGELSKWEEKVQSLEKELQRYEDVISITCIYSISLATALKVVEMPLTEGRVLHRVRFL